MARASQQIDWTPITALSLLLISLMKVDERNILTGTNKSTITHICIKEIDDGQHELCN
jgi:hypothetical protein